MRFSWVIASGLHSHGGHVVKRGKRGPLNRYHPPSLCHWLRVPPYSLGSVVVSSSAPAGSRCGALALNTAATASPSTSPRSASERRVTVATSGNPQSTTTRAPAAVTVTRALSPARTL